MFGLSNIFKFSRFLPFQSPFGKLNQLQQPQVHKKYFGTKSKVPASPER